MAAEEQSLSSPRWSNTIKLVISFTLVIILIGMIAHFQTYIPQIFLIVMIAYLINPIADKVTRYLRIPWKISVAIVYLLLLVLILGLVTFSGVSIVAQINNYDTLIKANIDRIPEIVESISKTKLSIGPFHLPFESLETQNIQNLVNDNAKALLSTTGDILTAVGSGTFNFLGWMLFVLLGSFFVLIENDELWEGIFQFKVPGYEKDIQAIGSSLSKIWNSFLRGQLIVMALSTFIYIIVLSVLGVSSALVLAIIAGLARFVPYIGPLILWIILAFTSYFQEFKFGGMDALSYTLLVVAIAWLIDLIMDNLVMPRILASSLEVHPVFILVGAILMYDLLGILGVILAAPLVATLQFFGRYVFRKLFDLDPWEGLHDAPTTISISDQIRNFTKWLRQFAPSKK